VEELFRMYYHNSGEYLNSIPDLVEAAPNVLELQGADTDTDLTVQSYLESDQGEAQVDELAKKILPMVQGVPTFLFKRSDKPNMSPPTFSGGQPPHMFELAFESLLEK
jgi:hypothetical protein